MGVGIQKLKTQKDVEIISEYEWQILNMTPLMQLHTGLPTHGVPASTIHGGTKLMGIQDQMREGPRPRL